MVARIPVCEGVARCGNKYRTQVPPPFSAANADRTLYWYCDFETDLKGEKERKNLYKNTKA